VGVVSCGVWVWLFGVGLCGGGGGGAGGGGVGGGCHAKANKQLHNSHSFCRGPLLLLLYLTKPEMQLCFVLVRHYSYFLQCSVRFEF
jgi:hypothetical protein